MTRKEIIKVIEERKKECKKKYNNNSDNDDATINYYAGSFNELDVVLNLLKRQR